MSNADNLKRKVSLMAIGKEVGELDVNWLLWTFSSYVESLRRNGVVGVTEDHMLDGDIHTDVLTAITYVSSWSTAKSRELVAKLCTGQF